ncbi:hypothetical protein [Planctomyces sp. SH-PL14]|jgi:hypothetical protein|uniref:hypothetical protein n=1 Tax=Planctomyces sp. SH-PL14 TaxID=1632864 RepID=UPI00078B8314|nr:hypothetical protein [Planctomyces sp. SH-PL14]AMV20044.1 hypothetical protein VT03_19270 [Planctomyces sp. SH-PL14]
MPTESEVATPFVDRRRAAQAGSPGVERRQFSDSRDNTRPEVAELASAVDKYKLEHRRRFITFEELYGVIESLGYHK